MSSDTSIQIKKKPRTESTSNSQQQDRARPLEDKPTQEKPKCSHPINFGGLCGVCGMDLTRYDENGVRIDSRVSIQISHENNMLFVSKEEAARIENETSKRLLRTRKLSLLLDLDQTVIHATVDPKIELYLNDPSWTDHLKDVYKFQLGDNQTYHVKLRPGFHDFLKEVNELFELHIYTMGTRNYATAISRIIDPKQEIFRERILSRDESGSITKKTIQRLFPCDDSMVVVVDDRADVWQWSENLFKVRPYVFFRATGDLNDPKLLAAAAGNQAPLSPSDLLLQEIEDCLEDDLPPEVSEDIPTIMKALEEDGQALPFIEDDNDSELETLGSVLREMHSMFYERYDKLGKALDIEQRSNAGINVKAILKEIRHRIFADCVFAFSGVIPKGTDAKKAEIWRFSEMFGAKCLDVVDDTMTHLIASKFGTEKVKEAQKLRKKKGNLWIIRPEWVFACVHSWLKLPEYEYVLTSENETTFVPEPQPPKSDLSVEFAATDSRPNSSLSFHVDGDSLLTAEEFQGIEFEIDQELDELSSDND